MNRPEFIEFVTTVGLVAPGELTNIDRELGSAETDDAGTQTLARLLVERGKLTKYQAAAIYQGKGKSLVFGDYLVIDRIGAGGMGQVFKARHRRMDRIVALKVMSAVSMKNADAVRRFEREVRAAAKLMHPNIVTALDAGSQDGVHYLVMEYVDGPDLASVAKSQGKLPVREACDYIAQAARGFAFAHGKGIVHRDIKPGNLLVDRDGTVKVLDMGLARFDDGGPGDAMEGDLTQNGSVMGTIDYMAPEQALNTRHADAKSDVYGLGCTLYRLLSGEAVYGGQTMVEKILAHRDHPIPALRKIRPDAPPALEALTARMLAKRPTDRPSMQEIADSLSAILSGAPLPPALGMPPGVPPAVPMAAPHASQAFPVAAAAPGTGPGVRPGAPAGFAPVRPKGAAAARKRSNMPLLAATGVGAVCIALGVWFFIRNKEEPPIAVVPGSADPAAPIVPEAPPTGTAQAAAPTATSSGTFAGGPQPSGTKPTGTTPSSTDAMNFFSPPSSAATGSTPLVAPVPGSPPPFVSEAAGQPSKPAPVPSPGDKTFANAFGIQFVLVPKGKAWLGGGNGAPGTQEIVVPQDFYLGTYELTERQWYAVLQGKPGDPDPERLPIIRVSWEQCRDFVKRLNERLATSGTGWVYRLPTEVEWEYACRGGPMTSPAESSFSFYFDTPTNTATPDQMNSAESQLKRAQPIGSYRPNKLGLYDMHGNTWDWCDDELSDPDGNPQRFHRGGGFGAPTTQGTASHRSRLYVPHSQFGTVGLRVALVSASAAPPAVVAMQSAPGALLRGPNGVNTPPAVSGAFPSADSRLPVPDADQRKAALELIRSVYKDGYAAARTPAKKSELAGKLLEQSRQSADPAERYVLLDEAVKLGAEGDDVDAARKALTELLFGFQVEASKTCADAWKAMLAGARPPEIVRALLGDMNGLFEGAVRGAKFDDAKAIGDFAAATSQRLRDVVEIKLVRDRNAELVERRRQYEAAIAATEKLAGSPDDPEANLTVGRYRGLVEKDWSAAVSHLAKGSDDLWKELAAKSIAAGGQPAALSAIADAWFDAAHTRPAQKAEFLAAARFWYEASKNTLTGVQRTRVENRITEAGLFAVESKLPVTLLPALPAPAVPSTNSGATPPISASAPPATGVVTATAPPPPGDDKPFMPVRTFGDAKPVTTGAAATPRAIAQRILSMQGNVRVLEPNGAPRDVKTAAELPAGDFDIIGLTTNHADSITDADLATIGTLKKLQRLFLQNSQITGSGFVYLKDLPELEFLGINRCPLTDAGLAHLSGGVPKLIDLNITYTSVTDAGMVHLRSLTGLKNLNLLHTSITDAGMQAVAQLPNLEILGLDRTSVGDAGLEALANHGKIQTLALRMTRITDRSMAALATLKSLKLLWLTNTGVSEAAVQSLRTQLPQAKINTAG